MTNELEKKFFNAFGIKPNKGCTAYDKFTEEEADVICNDKCAECSYLDDVYPQITDRILLNLICIANEYQDYPTSTNIKNIQARTLRMLLKTEKYLENTYSRQDWHNDLVIKVRKLFKGDNNV